MKKFIFILATLLYIILLIIFLLAIAAAIFESKPVLIIVISILLILLFTSYLIIYKKTHPTTSEFTAANCTNDSTFNVEPNPTTSLDLTSFSRYQILSTLDKHTCEVCGNMDLLVFNENEYEEGITAPPFHEACRCTTIPFFDDLSDSIGDLRIARNPITGKSYYVQGDITWKKWKKTLNPKIVYEKEDIINQLSENTSQNYSYQDYSVKWIHGKDDISLYNSPSEGFILNDMPYVKYDGAPYNRYLLEGRNKEIFIDRISQVIDTAKNNIKLLQEVEFQRMEFEPRLIDHHSSSPWDIRQATVNNEFCWLRDTRFTKTGRVSKNAYVLHFSDNPVKSYFDQDNYETSFGEISITAEHTVNKGRLVQWKGRNSIVITVKSVEDNLVINYIEKNGQNILNT